MVHESRRRCRQLCCSQVRTRTRMSLVTRKERITSAKYVTKRLHLERDCGSISSITPGITRITVQCVVKDSLLRVITRTMNEFIEEEFTRVTRLVVERRSRHSKRTGIINPNIRGGTDFYALNVVKDSTLNNCTMNMRRPT